MYPSSGASRLSDRMGGAYLVLRSVFEPTYNLGGHQMEWVRELPTVKSIEIREPTVSGFIADYS